MLKQLTSGILIEDKIYYELLEWKDKHINLFKAYCNKMNYPTSINNMSLKQINDILKYSQYW